MYIRFRWDDPITEEPQQIVAPLPVAIGREAKALPEHHRNQPVYSLVFGNSAISRQHLIIFRDSEEVLIEDLNSTNGTTINGTKFKNANQKLHSGDILKLASFHIDITLLQSMESSLRSKTSVVLSHSTNVIPASEISKSERAAYPSSTIIFNPQTDQVESRPLKTSVGEFPFNEKWNREFVSLSDLYSSNHKVEETTYVSLGGGMGSFVFVDTLRIYGVTVDQVVAIGLKLKPYERYQSLLENCQIKTKYRKRIRSGSDSCPDNIWGFPGYALRDAWRAFSNGEAGRAIYHLWQVFSEPIGADTYTPRAEDVFSSMDAEMERIRWSQIIRSGVIKSIRKTNDDRYAIAYIANQASGKQEEKFLLVRYVHLCTGYPALKLLPDLQTYRDKYDEAMQNVKSIVHGYEPHDYIYEALEDKGGVIVIRGFGIVASQILDRIHAARSTNKKIKVYHIGRTRKDGNRFPPAERYVEFDWEFQPYNWPKACWGGDMRSQLEAADPLKRRELLEAWGGTTTASRSSWRKYIRQGLKDRWYEQVFGQIESIDKEGSGRLIIELSKGSNSGTEKITADYVVDCTGLVSDPQASPLLNDLIRHYDLDLNPQKRLHTQNDFEIRKMRTSKSRMYASGIITLGSSYAGVDTFLGLQYSAHRIAESLTRIRTPQMQGLNPLRSLEQWIKWIMRQTP